MKKRSGKRKFEVVSRTLNLKGGSFVVTIPRHIVEGLGLEEGKQLVFILDPEKKYAMIGKSETFGLKSEVFEADVEIYHSLLTEEELIELLKNIKEKQL